MKDDPVISRIRAARHSISKECEHDPKQLVEYYQKRQKERQQQSGMREEKGIRASLSTANPVNVEMGSNL